MKSTERTAQLRRQRRQIGLKETTIWLAPEIEEIIVSIVRQQGLKNRSEGIAYALRAFSQEQRITA